MILRPGIREVTGATPEGVPTGTTRICGFDAFYGFGSLEPNTIGEHTITSLFWRDGYAQVVVAGEAPRNLFEKIVIKFPGQDYVLDSRRARVFSPTVHGDSCWVWHMANPGSFGGDFEVGVA